MQSKGLLRNYDIYLLYVIQVHFPEMYFMCMRNLCVFFAIVQIPPNLLSQVNTCLMLIKRHLPNYSG